MGTVGDTALVIGGGFAGMLAARALADFFRHVIVCEKDLLADDALPRRGVPQGPHIHGPLLGTIHILSELFPGLPAELAAGITGAQGKQHDKNIAPEFHDIAFLDI